ncbi:TPA: 4Fe-4S dicluster domain-containing protein [Candidatus Geothermarchaeota archaeon]|nr:4Fe-4S dicluster domain-containing protein [Candidatus Geothermarchaeota archaeon]
MAQDIGIEHFIFVKDIEFIVYISAVISIAIFLYGVYLRMIKWFDGFPSLSSLNLDLKQFIGGSLTQLKVLRKPAVGSAHALVFYGFIILFIGTILRALEYDITMKFLGTRFLVGSNYLIFKLFMNIGGLIAIIGLVALLIRRLGFKSRYLPDRPSDYILIITLLIILFTGFLLDSIATASYRLGWIGYFDFIGVSLAYILLSLNLDLTSLYRGLWLFHMFISLASAALIPYTKLGHMVFGGIFNYIFRRPYHKSAFKGYKDPEAIVDEKGYLGALSLKDLSWKERMDLDACIECSRCTDVCPATESGKPLSPMHLILDLRSVMNRGDFEGELVPKYIDPDVLWSCVTCGACVDACPMNIHHVESILDIRKGLISKGEDVPEDALNVSYNLMRYGNPMGYDPMDRVKIIEEISSESGVEIADESREYEYIYWIGCQTAFDPNNRGIAISTLKLLRKAGVDVAILPDEVCCGEPARRIGDELMYKELVEMNKENLMRYRFKKLVVNCPHGYNVFKHEYREYGIELDVIHHSQLLSKLVREGRLKPVKSDTKVTFHDPCFLGRWNGVFDDPRDVVKSVVGDSLIEMPRNRENSFCCGAGGGQMYYEVKKGRRISSIRFEEAVKTGAKVICTACPYCKVMLSAESKGEVEVKDISEYLSESIDRE